MDGQPLKPLSHGNILIVGAKNSNFDEEILTHPRVILWSSQQEHWTNKDLPSNVTAVFVTRWIGHAAFGKIIAEARKKHITMFNPEGTGQIARQVKELLAMNKPIETITMTEPPRSNNYKPGSGITKLHKFLPFVDWTKSNAENVRAIMPKAAELGIQTTVMSLSNFLGIQRKRLGVTAHTKNTHPKAVNQTPAKTEGLDVSVQLLDDAIKNLQDIRAYLLSTATENTRLKARLDMFKKALAE